MTSLNAVSTLFGGTAPHSLTELYGVEFDGGGAAPASGNPINLLAFNGKSPVPFTYGTYSTTNLVPPVMNSTSQNNYVITARANANELTGAFDRTAGTNWRGPGGHFLNNVYGDAFGPVAPTTWTGVGTFTAPWIGVQLPQAKSVTAMVIRPQAVTNGGQKIRLLGSNNNSNWTIVFQTDEFIQYDPDNLTASRDITNNMPPTVIQFPQATAAYKYYVYLWLENTRQTGGGYLPRVAQFNLVTT